MNDIIAILNFFKKVLKYLIKILKKLWYQILIIICGKKHLIKYHDSTLKTLIYDSYKPNFYEDWIFHDDNWNHVINRWENRRLLAKGLKLSIIDNYQPITDEVVFESSGIIKFSGTTETNDEWIYLYLDSSKYIFKNFCWIMTICKENEFKEFQFGFRYKDFYNRYRYRFENNKIYFDIVKNGKFYNDINSVPFKMTIGKNYKLNITAVENHFACYIDDKLMLYDIDFKNHFSAGSAAIILWEDNGTNPLRGSVGPLKIYDFDKNEY